jgi:uncharacterized protein (DUF1800 family)
MTPFTLPRSAAASALIALLLCCTACGGGQSPAASTNTNSGSGTNLSSQALAAVPEVPPSNQDAARFLTQATFGPTQAETTRLMRTGYQQWLSEQFAKPLPEKSHLAYWDERAAAGKSLSPAVGASIRDVISSFWAHAIGGDDQLRQRVAFALSEVFVVSMADTCADQNSRGTADYLDMLGRNAFGSYRQLLEDVAMHPIMGCYLSHIHNAKEDPAKGRIPDENFAREVMQLFSIGLYELNPDGTRKQTNGVDTPTYGPSDIAGMAKVFTGFSWECPLIKDDGCFDRGVSYQYMWSDPARWTTRMQAYSRFHSTSEKAFLKVKIDKQDTPDPSASLKFALDTLAQHPNVGPFIGKQLIQRLVTSNPSPAYVERVSNAFKASGGNLKAMVYAILMDPEARDTQGALASNTFGKVREPILRLTALLRAYDAKSRTGSYLISFTSEGNNSLNQQPLTSPTVFNFFRPGYTPPGSFTAKAPGKLVAPEMQIVNETSVAGYVNFMRDVLLGGIGGSSYFGTAPAPDGKADVRMAYMDDSNHAIRKLADKPADFVEDLNQRLLYGNMSSTLRTDLTDLISNIKYGEPETTQNYRINTALLITLASPEFLVQR